MIGSVEELFTRYVDEIESMDFCTSLGVASTFSVFTLIARSKESYLGLVGVLIVHRDFIGQLYNRAIFLLRQKADGQYENPHDTILTVFLIAIDEVSPDKSRDLSEHILKVPNLWWAKMLARKIYDRGLPENVISFGSSDATSSSVDVWF